MALPGKLLFIRHAEKPDAANGGVDETGNHDQESLSPRGWQRAGALAVWFRIEARLARPAVIFAPAPTPSAPSRRALQTIMPLARVLGLEPRSAYTKDDFARMLTDAMSTQGVVLVSWEHNVLAASLMAGLGPGISVEGDVPSAWPSDRFDVVWVFDHVTDDHYRFTQVPQLVLEGDSSEPLG